MLHEEALGGETAVAGEEAVMKTGDDAATWCLAAAEHLGRAELLLVDMVGKAERGVIYTELAESSGVTGSGGRLSCESGWLLATADS